MNDEIYINRLNELHDEVQHLKNLNTHYLNQITSLKIEKLQILEDINPALKKKAKIVYRQLEDKLNTETLKLEQKYQIFNLWNLSKEVGGPKTSHVYHHNPTNTTVKVDTVVKSTERIKDILELLLIAINSNNVVKGNFIYNSKL